MKNLQMYNKIFRKYSLNINIDREFSLIDKIDKSSLKFHIEVSNDFKKKEKYNAWL